MTSSLETRQIPECSLFQFPICNQNLYGERRPDIATVPVHDIGELLADLGKFRVNYAGCGSLGVVFRVEDPEIGVDSTIKVVRAEGAFPILQRFYEASGLEKSEDEVDRDCIPKVFAAGLQTPRFAVAHQVKGHLLGNRVAPDYIDIPTAIWINTSNQRELTYVGYSIPFIEGQAIRIAEDDELKEIAEQIEKRGGIYLGNRSGGSLNAIVNQETGVKKFIDVKMKRGF